MAINYDIIIPLVLTVLSCTALAGKHDVYSLLVTGAGEGLQTLKTLIPPLGLLLTAVQMLRSSGARDLMTQLLSPACRLVGIPPETVPLLVIRPISGSAALAVGGELITAYGPDSSVGRTVAVMLGSTETTFSVVSVYFGAAGIKRTRYAIPAALIADLTGFLTASWITNQLW